MKSIKKTILSGLGIVFVIGLLLFLFFSSQDTNLKNFQKKVNLLEKSLEENKDFLSIQQEDFHVILSVCDKQSQATVKSATANSFQTAYEKVKNETEKFIKENNYPPIWVKMDVIHSLEETTKESFETELKNSIKNYSFRKGILLKIENRQLILTEAELNANQIIDYKNHTLNLTHLNDYLKRHNEIPISDFPNTFETFTTISSFCDQDHKIYELCHSNENTGRRKQENLETTVVNDMIKNATNYLFDMVQEDGKFVYGYRALDNKENISYNMVRHAGAIWGLLTGYEEKDDKNGVKKQKIEKSIDFLNRHLAKEETFYHLLNESGDEISLGGNGLALVALCEYMQHFQDTKYLETAKKLGDGILSMQNENGKFVNKLSAKDYSVQDIEGKHYNYYAGEATLALGKLYGITQDKKYLEAAQKAMDYFVQNDYANYSDHWTSYAANEITKYVDTPQYYELGLKNVNYQIDKMLNKKTTSHTDLEMLMQCFELYRRILERNLEIAYTQVFSIDTLQELIDYRVQLQLNSYLYPEIAMYLTYPKEYCNTFFIRQDGFRIRIDDIQHSVVGFYYYDKNCLQN